MKKLLKWAGVGLVLLAGSVVIWWVATTPPAHHVIGPAYVMQPIPQAIEAVRTSGDAIGERLETIAREIPGYDDIVLQPEFGRAFVTAQDGWIWRLDLSTGEAQRFVNVPLMPAGAHEMPGDANVLCFCGMYLYGAAHGAGERVGLYTVDLTTKEIRPLLQRVPNPPSIREAESGEVFPTAAQSAIPISELTEQNSRPLMFCNDFDVSSDGKRFYVSEPFAYEGASMGGGAYFEAITLGNNGRLWKLDVDTGMVSLVAQDFTFVDGVLLEEDEHGLEQSVIVSETVKFKLTRLYLAGPRAGAHETIWESLPGMPDGLERDRSGNIWIGLITQRSETVTRIHATPWVKPLLMRVPPSLLPVSKTTGVLALSPDGSTPVWFAEHGGDRIQSIAAVVPDEDYVYLASFTPETPGVHRMPNPMAP